MSLFADSELVFTRNAKDNTYMGGGYVLKSEFMEGGAPPIFNLKMGNGGGGSDGGDGGDDSSDGGDGGNKHRKGRRANNNNNNKNKKVSSLLFDGTRAVPAGLFLMNNRRDAQSIYDDSRINSFLNDSGSSSSNDGSSSSNDGSSSDDGSGSGNNKNNKSGGNRHRRHNNAAVVPETLYDTLLKMLAPDADKRRYWANGAKTQRRGHSNNKDNNKSNTRKK